MVTMTARSFNHNPGAAKRAAATGPVIITDRGAPTHVMLSYEQYRRLAGERRSLGDAFVADDDYEVPQVTRHVDESQEVQW